VDVEYVLKTKSMVTSPPPPTGRVDFSAD
jgi:hypothetical protein